jgi:hypothetical protein
MTNDKRTIELFEPVDFSCTPEQIKICSRYGQNCQSCMIPAFQGSVSIGTDGTIIYEAPGMTLQEEEACRQMTQNPDNASYTSCSMGARGTPEQINKYNLESFG